MKLKQFIFALVAMLSSFAFTANAQQLLVNCDYNSSTEGWGTTKFSNYNGAYAYATANGKTSATIVIEKTTTISGNCFDNNHKNYSRLAVVIKDGATMGNAASKWDMTYPVTVEPGGTLTCARPKNSSVSNIHIKNKLIVGAKGATKKAYVNFLSDSYQDCDISIRYNGSIEVYNADFHVQDLDAQGKLTIEDSKVEVDGAFASATYYATTLTNTEMVVNGNLISGGLADFAGGSSNQLGNVKLNNSTLTIKDGDTKVVATVTATNSTIDVDNLIVNSGKTLNLNNGSTLEAANITTAGNGSVKIDGVVAPIVDGAICVPVSDFAALKSAVEAGKNVQLTADITTTYAIKTSGVTSVIDLNGKTLTIGAGDNKFNDESNITIKNGTVSITGVTVGGNAIFCLDEYEKALVTTLTLDNVNVVGEGYSSAYGVFYIGESSVLNVKGGEWNLKNDTHASGGVFKADGSGAKLNINGLNLTAHNVRRVVTYAATTIENSTMAISGDADGVDAQMEHGFNRSPLAIKNSTITMKDMVGRGITAQNGAVTISENSKVEMTNCQEATIDVRNNQTVTIDNTSTVSVDKKPTVASGSAINGTVKLPPVAKIGETPYATLIAAIAAVQDGETITLIADETFTAANYSDNGGWRDGVAYSGDQSFTIDLDGHTIGQDGYLNDYLFWFKNAGSKENTITIKNGTLDAGNTAFCALCTANSHDNKLTVNTENVNLINNISNGSTVKIRAGSVYNAKAGTKITGKNSYLGIENWNATVNIYDGVEIYMNGTSSDNGCLVGVGGNGTINVYGGKGKGVSGGLIAMTSGGTINVEGGEWIANTDGTFANSNKSVLIAQSDKKYNAGAGNAVVNVTGGTFKGGYNCYGNKVGDAQINIKGGNFNADPASYVAENYVAVKNNNVWNVVKAAAKIGTTGYASLEAAINKVQNGETITLIADVAENVTLTEKTGLYYTIDGNGKTMKGSINVASLSDTEDNRRITISGINFVDETDANVDFISSVNTNHYPRLTIEGCTFTGSGNDGDVAVRLKSSHSVVIKDCTATGLHSFIQNTSGWNLTIENVTVTDSKSGFALGTVQGVTVKGATIDVAGYGIRLDAQYNNNAVIESNKIEAFIPVVVRKAEVNSNITVKGTNTMTATNGDGIWFAAGTSEYETSGSMPTAATGKVVVTLNDATLSNKGIYGDHVVLAGKGTEAEPYLINNIKEFEAFRSSVNAGDNYSGKFVKLNADIDLNNEQWEPIGYMGKNFVGNFDGGNFTISNLKVTKELTNAAENNGVGLFGRLDSPATIKNLTIENATVTGSLYVGAVVGYAYTGKAIENVTVKGDIAINAYWYAGVIGGNGYMNLVNNCHVIGNNGSYIKGNNGSYIGGIWGFRGEGANKITNCTVTNLSIEGVDRVGGISGMAHYGNTISDCAVKNTAVKATDAKATTVGLIAGACQGTTDEPSIITGSTVENVKVTVADSEVVASLYGTNINGTTPVTNYVAKIGVNYYESFEAAITAAQAGQTVSILKAGTYALKVKDGITITGAVAGVEFANIGAFGCNGANVTFNNVTFTYATNSTYKGLQHSGDLVYNNCTFNGQVFLYGESETFNNCTFNTTDSNNYNVWTYGAKNVAFNECTFNSAGKSVLVYTESATATNDVAFTKCVLKASAPVDGKAAIEMDSSLSGAINLTIDGETTATGFANGNVSGNSLWNNKKGNKDVANNDITVVVGDETVLAPAPIVVYYQDGTNEVFYDMLKAVPYTSNYPKLEGATIKLLADVAASGLRFMENDMVFDLNGHTYTITAGTGSQGTNTSGFQIRPEVTTDVTFKNGTIKVAEGAPVVYMFNNYATNFILEDVTVDCTNMAWSYGNSCYVVVSRGNATTTGARNVEFKGNTTIENFNSSVAGTAYSIDGTMTVGENVECGGSFKLAAGATLTAKEGLVVETVDGYILAYNNGVYATISTTANVATYAELKAAIANADIKTIVLTADINCGTEQLAIAKEITLDLGGNTLTTGNAYGGMSIKNNPTVKNGTIVHASNTAAIKVWNATAFENLVIDVQGKGDANKTIGGIVLQSGSTTKVGSIKNVTIKGAALTNGIETYNCGDAAENVIGAMENVNIDAKGTGLLIYAPCGTATNCDIKGGVNGVEIFIKGNYSASLDLVNSKVDGGVYAHDEFSSNPSIVNNGTLNFTADAATTGASAADVTLEIARAEADKVQGVLNDIMTNAKAKLNNVYYATLDAAIAAAKAGDTVTVFEGTYAVPAMKAGITIVGEGNVLFEGTLSGTLENLTMKNIHIKGGNAQRWAYAKGNLLFENVTFEGTSVYALHFDGITAGATLTYKDCTIIGWAALGGSPASCVFEGCTIKGNGTYGVIRTYFDTTIKECTFDVANVSTTDVYQDGIHAVSGATVTVTDCTNANGDMTDIVNVGDTSIVVLDDVEIKNAAQAGDKYYATFAEALAAVQDGETLTLLADLNLSEILVLDKSVTLDGNGKKLTSTAGRAINVSGANGVTIQNLTIVASGERAINVIQNATNVTIENVTATAANYTVNVAASAPNAVVAINNSTLNGLCTVNVAAAAAQVTVDNSIVNCNDNNTTVGEAYAALCLNKDAVGGSIVAINSTINVTDGSDSMKGRNGAENGTVSINGSTDDIAVMVAVITYEDSDYYYSFATLEAAIKAAKAGETIELIRNVTMDYNARDAYETQAQNVVINGNGKVLTLNQKNSDWASFGLANNSKLVLNNMTIEKTGYGDTNGAWNTHAIIFSCPVEMNGVTVNNSVAVQAGATLNNVTINEANGYYGLWINGNGQTVTVNGGAINATKGGRGIKIADEYIDAPAQVTLNVNGTVFNTAKKAAVLVSSTAGAKITAANVNIANVAEDKVNFVWVDEDWAQHFAKVEVTGATVRAESADAFTAAITANGAVQAYYKTLAEAINAAEAGATVELLADVTLAGGYEDATEGLRIEKEITLNGNDHTIDCGNFQKGIRVYNSSNVGDFNVNFNNVKVVNNVANGRCIDTRSGNINLKVNSSTLIATNGNSQPLTIGGNDPVHRVTLNGTTIDAGTSGYAVISFVSTNVDITGVNNSTISGFAAFYLKGNDKTTNLNLGQGVYTGTNNHAVESGLFGTVVLEGNNNVVNLMGTNATVKAVANNTAPQAAFLVLGDNNIIKVTKESAKIITEGNAYEAMVKADNAATTTFVDMGIERKLVAENSGYQFYSFEDAVRFAGNEGTIKIVNDFELADTWTIPAGKTVTLDLNGKTISQSKACTASYEMINNKGNLTITGNGKISFKDTSAGDPNFGWGSYTVRNEGTLVVENGTIEHLGEQAFGKHCIMALYQYCGSTTINGGTISTPNYRSARLWKGDMTINGGTFDGQVWVQAVDSTAKLTINGGTFAPKGNDASAVFVTNNQYDVQFAVTNGTFNGKVGCSDAAKLANAITGGKFNAAAVAGTNVDLIAFGYEFGAADADGYQTVYNDESVLYIATLADLKAFRDEVNSGANYYAGVNVYLAADIDMTGENWVGIGSAAKDHGFMGNFDGQGHKIMNLTINNPTLDSEGYAYAGLFGVTEGTDKNNQNTIKNLIIENVTINTTGHIVSAAIAYPYYTIVNNVKVCGNIAINGGDYTAGVLAYTRRCVNASNLSIIGESNSFVKGNKVVGGVISDIQTNGGLVADYKNFSAEGITVSGAKCVGAISGIISAQNLDNATVKNVELNSQDGFAGIVAGRLGTASTVTNVSYENVTGAATLIGGGYDSAKAVQAKIGNTYYQTLEAALKAEGNEVVELLAPVTIAKDETVVLDLNGKTVTYTSAVAGEDMITNRGNLTITDSSDAKNGKFAYVNTDATASNVTVSTISTEAGSTLVVDGGTIENKTVKADGSSIYSYAIDILTNGNLGDVNVTINGGTVYSDYMAIRQFNNGTACKNSLTINGGYIYGAKRAVQVHMDNNAAVTAIKGGKIEAGEGGYAICNFAKTSDLAVTGGEFIGTVYSASENFISGGIYDAEVYAGYCAEGYMPNKNVDGTYGVVLVADVYASIDGVTYGSLKAAINAAKAGETITLLQDVTENVTISKNLTIDGAGNTITGMITTDGKSLKVTIKNVKFDGNNGTINYAMRADDDLNLLVENCTVNNYMYGFLYANKSNDKIVVKNVTVENCASYGAYLVSFNSASFENFKVSGARSGILVDNSSARKVNLKNVTFEGVETPLATNDKGTSIVTFAFDGINDMSKAEFYTSQYVNVVAAAQVGTKVCGSLNDAFAAAQTGDTVKMLGDLNLGWNDVVVNNAGQKVLANVDGKNITFDMNGKKISVDHRSTEAADRIFSVICVEDGAGLTVKGNGSIDVTTGVTDANVMPKVAYMFWKRGTTGYLVIEDGNYHMDNSEDSMVYTNGDDIVTVNGGSFTLDAIGTRVNGFPWIFNVAGNGTANVTVTGGIYNYDIRKQFWAQEVKLADGLTMRHNDDGTWTVVDAIASVVGADANVKESYGSIQEAIDAAQNGETVKLLVDVELSESLNNTKEITLDLNGKTVTGVDTTTKNFGLINNNGTLTIVGDGIIELTATENSGWNRYSAVISNNPGATLTINSGTIEHLGGTDMAYGIDNLTNGSIGDVNCTINGGTIKSTYRAIRQFLNSDSKENNLTINGGVIEGANKSIFFHDPSTKANNGTLTVAETAEIYSDVYLFVTEGSTEWPVNVSIADYALAEGVNVVSKNVPANYEVVLYNDVHSVEKTYLDELTIVDGQLTEFVNKNNKTIGKLTYKRTFANASNQAFYVPFEVPMSKIKDNFNVYYISNMHAYDNNEDAVADSLVLEAFKVPANAVLKANYPYIIRAKEAGTSMEIKLDSATLYSLEEKSVECSSVFMKFEITGNYHKMEGEEILGKYALKSGTWQEALEGAYLNPFRMYMTITKSDDSPYTIPADALRSIGIRIAGEQLEDGTTVIYHVEAENNSEDVIFDLSGRRVLKAEKGGIYIINGKKVLVK